MEELLSLKWNNHRSTFLHILSILRDKQLYTDATLACEGRFYSVHRLVLSTCSDYFSAMFDRTTCKNPIIVLKDIKCEDLEALLDYMYLGEVNVRQADLASLIKAAECLRVKGLAVPDDEPPARRGSRGGRGAEGGGSPPAKRKRREESGQDGREDVRPPPPRSSRSSPPASSRLSPAPGPQDDTDHGVASPSHLQRPSSSELPQGNGTPSSSLEVQTPFVKVEREDHTGEDMGGGGGDSFDVHNDSFKEEANDDQVGELSNDLPEFLQQSGDNSYPHTFAGPSFQPELQNWQGDQVLSSNNFSGLGFPSQSQESSPNTSGRSGTEPASSGSMAAPAASSSLVTSSVSPMAVFGAVLASRQLSASSARTRDQFSCIFCTKSFMTGWELRRHLHAHGDTRPFRCPYCTHRSNFKHNLKSHIQMVHRGMPFTFRMESTPPFK